MKKLDQIPIIPLRDVVVYPHMVIPLFIGRVRSTAALEYAVEAHKPVLLLKQKDESIDTPTVEQLNGFGCLAKIVQMLKLPDGNVKLLVEGEARAEVLSITEEGDAWVADLNIVQATGASECSEQLIAKAITMFKRYVKLNKRVPNELIATLDSTSSDPDRLADMMAIHALLQQEDSQKVLELLDVKQRLEFLIEKISAEVESITVEKSIRGRVKDQMEQSQREYYLNEQLKAIQKELGEIGGEQSSELEQLAVEIERTGMPEDVQAKAEQELNKLRMMPPASAEATVVRSYIDWLIKLPWNKYTDVQTDLTEAEAVLEKEHYGLEEVKERIIEYLVVQKRVKKPKGPILCLVGPPGVGKTSLGQSIANATGREFLRIALGGVRDEAEIRGHRRTYIGAQPGKLIQKLVKAGVKNPLVLFDEVDKMGMDMRGDPASALLEVLDPEQNHTFNDHYLEVDYDLSEVMFVTTANSMNIPQALLDRMEVIRLPGYTEDEKLNIAQKYLLPKQRKANGLAEDEVVVSSNVILTIIRYYTREAGVRNLERQLSKLTRKVARNIVMEQQKVPVRVTVNNLSTYLGVRLYDYGKRSDDDRIGQVIGLAWTEVGGDLLTIEATAMPGKGNTTFTGHLGDIMQESIKTALTVVRSRAEQLSIAPDFYQSHDIHVHVPEGATPKDGPSAGIAMCTALVSTLTQRAVHADIAMTGEITLRGEILPIGGLKEKLLAASRGGISRVIIPEENQRHLTDIPDKIKKHLEIIPLRWIDDVFELALTK